MKNFFFLSLLMLSINIHAHALNLVIKTSVLKVVVNVPFNTPSGDKIYITGNFNNCKWQADCFLMEQIDRNTYQALIPVPDFSENYELKITRGSFDSEEVSSHSQVPRNHTIFLSDQLNEYVYTVANWKDLKPLAVEGELDTFNLYSHQLKKNKRISVLLPESYSKQSTKKYPVIYMHDGQNLFSPRLAVFSNEWSIDEVLRKQYRAGLLPEVIVVAVDSDNMERSLEYNFYKKGKLYADFMVKTLKSFIDKNYRTKSKRESTFLMGSSFGALISFTMLWEYPQIYKKAAGLSFPAHAKEHYISRFLQEFPQIRQDIFFYMDRGDYAIDAGYAPHTNNFKNELIRSGFEIDNLFFKIFPYANHTELDWARRVHIPLNFLLRD